MRRVTAIVQARMSASRLPGKVLLDIGGKPMLEWVVARTNRAKLVDDVVVATTFDPSDDPVYEYCQQKKCLTVRGATKDVLDRYYQAAKSLSSEIIVRITADCPLIDPELIDQALTLILPERGTEIATGNQSRPQYDFVANRLPSPWKRTYPIGLDIEIFTFELLAKAWENAGSKHQREHVTPFFYENAPVDRLNVQTPFSPISQAITSQGYRIALMHHSPDYGDMRWTVDTHEDLKAVRAIASYFPDDTFSWKEVIDVVSNNPGIMQINALVEHKTHLDVDDRN